MLHGWRRAGLALLGQLVTILVIGLVNYITVYILLSTGRPSVILPTLMLVYGYLVFLTFALAPLIKNILSLAEAKKITIRQSWSGATALVGKMFWSQLLAFLAVVGGLFLFVVPGLVLAVWFSLVPYVVVSEGKAGRAALRRSRELVRGHFVEVAGALGLSLAVNLFWLLPIDGPLVSIIAGALLLPIVAVRYRQLVELPPAPAADEAEEAEKPVSHDADSDEHAEPSAHKPQPATRPSAWNYLAIALAIVGLSVVLYHDMTAFQAPGQVENRQQIR